jgi:hypothetical protein
MQDRIEGPDEMLIYCAGDNYACIHERNSGEDVLNVITILKILPCSPYKEHSFEITNPLLWLVYNLHVFCFRY